MRASVFVGMSVDGFIARSDHSLDFLSAGGDGDSDHGFADFLASVDALVMGRRTYDVVHGFPTWPYGEKPVFVLSTRELQGAPGGAVVSRLNGDPAQVVRELASRGLAHLYVDGGETIQRFLRAGLITDITVSRVPVLIGSGISLLGSLEHDVRLMHVSTRTFKGGMVQTHYTVDGASKAG